MYIDKRIVKDFLFNWLKLVAGISGFVGLLAFMIWTMILGDQFFGDIGWIGAIIIWLAGALAALMSSLEHERRKQL